MVGIRPLPLAFVMFALLAPASASAAPPTRIIVQHEPGLSAAQQREIRTDARVHFAEKLTVPDLEIVTVPSRDANAALARLNSDPDVRLAEVDGKVHAFGHGQPDPFMGEMWWFQNAGDPNQVAYELVGTTKVRVPTVEDADMDVPEAWAMSEGAGTLVGVADSGVDATHPDLDNRIAPGYDWVDEDDTPDDPDGHGTHVTGTIAADANNGRGGAGIAPEARVLPLRVLDENGSGNVSDIVEAFHFAGEQGLRIVNASFGAHTADPLERQEIARWPDTLFVAAAGNESKDDDNSATAQYPCAFDLPNVLCVGASTAEDQRAPFSNFGDTSVDVYAPGQAILSTYKSHGYAYSDGTSMAAPQVAGLAALLLGRDAHLTTAELKQAILGTVDQRDGLTSVSGGRVNAESALNAVDEDPDSDQVVGFADNCPVVFNPDQADVDGVPGGDACADGATPPDRDSDGIADDIDACPFQFGPAETEGCPGLAQDANGDGLLDVFDADGDGVSDNVDKCPRLAGDSQVDSDDDGIGNECDTTPRGPDVDHDGKPALDDACPTVYGTLPNGCPKPKVTVTPTPPPAAPADRDHDGRLDRVDSCPTEPAATPDGCPLPYLTALSTKARKRHGKRYATIVVRTSRAASVQITVQRKRGHRWVKVTRRVRASSGNRVTLKVNRLRKGSYRAVVVVSSPAGRAAAVTKRFRVR
jgi:hypothetical protein